MKFAAVLFAGLCLLGGCGSKPAQPYTPPNTPAGKLRSIAYLPFMGSGLGMDHQQKRAAEWRDWWSEVYPGTTWSLTSETAQKLSDAGLTDTWLAAEKGYMQLGLLPIELIRQLCAAQRTDGVLQVAIAGVQAGAVGGSWWQPWWRSGGGTPSTARMTAALYACASAQVVWRHSADLTYQANYTSNEMVEYVHRELAAGIPR